MVILLVDDYPTPPFLFLFILLNWIIDLNLFMKKIFQPYFPMKCILK